MDHTGHDTFTPAVEQAHHGENETTITGQPLSARTPMPSSPVGCSAEHTTRKSMRDVTATPAGRSNDRSTADEKGKINLESGRKERKIP